MKKIFSVFVAALMAASASAQITWNAKGGVGIANCYGDDLDLKSHIVGKVGVGIEKPLSQNWSLMPSLEVAWKGAKYNEGEAGYSFEQTLNTFYVQVPIVAAYRINLSDSWNVALKIGPYFAYGISGSMEGNVESGGQSWSEDFDIFSDGEASRFDAGLDVGVDFECHRFVFGLEYERGFVNFAPDGEDGGSIKNSAFYVTVGWKF